MSFDEVEETQQQITRTLQQIDENFCKAHTVASEMVGQVKGFTQNMQRIHRSIQVWKRFFDSFEEAENNDRSFSNADESVTMDQSRIACGNISSIAETPASSICTPSFRTSFAKTPGTRSGIEQASEYGSLMMGSPPRMTPFLKASRTPGIDTARGIDSIDDGSPIDVSPPISTPFLKIKDVRPSQDDPEVENFEPKQQLDFSTSSPYPNRGEANSSSPVVKAPYHTPSCTTPSFASPLKPADKSHVLPPTPELCSPLRSTTLVAGAGESAPSHAHGGDTADPEAAASGRKKRPFADMTSPEATQLGREFEFEGNDGIHVPGSRGRRGAKRQALSTPDSFSKSPGSPSLMRGGSSPTTPAVSSPFGSGVKMGSRRLMGGRGKLHLHPPTPRTPRTPLSSRLSRATDQLGDLEQEFLLDELDDFEKPAPAFDLSLFPRVFRDGDGASQITAVYSAFADKAGAFPDLSLDELSGLLPNLNEAKLELLVETLVSRRLLKPSYEDGLLSWQRRA